MLAHTINECPMSYWIESSKIVGYKQIPIPDSNWTREVSMLPLRPSNPRQPIALLLRPAIRENFVQVTVIAALFPPTTD